MKQLPKQALFATILLSNVSLSSASSLALDNYFQNSLEASSHYTGNLLKLNTKIIHISIFEPVVNNNLVRPLKKPVINCFKTGKRIPKLKPLLRIIRRRVRPLPKPSLKNKAVSRLVDNVISKTQQRQSVQKLLKDMSLRNEKILLQPMNDDITAAAATTKIQANLITSDLSNQEAQIQNLTERAFQEVEESYYLASEAASKVLAARYTDRKRVFSNQDKQDAELAAKQAIQELQSQKKILILRSRTIFVLGRIALQSAISKVQANDENRN
ncbi:hypothetical protein [Iningainema tapete]|uniref:Uncharacterized protein n=1 Tax=Iningainema tapete BLCC-T55 TaxID=2748662 RepID=A0A8J7C8W9_9CYAN|nr:hypothetical protein [Iningainema tapete]MBD2777314.1 hypothetical protein [Iningainema tapete BLCC-T55]